MKESDIQRIIHMHLAPINISVQSTNPELRCKMLNNRFAGEKLKFLDTLYEHHIETVSYTHLDVYKRQAGYLAVPGQKSF